jgi:hypothetical protein
MRPDYFLMGTSVMGKIFGKKKKDTVLDHCLNCNNPLVPVDQYCSACGQKAVTSKVTIFELIGEFFSSVLNLDNSIWRTIGGLVRPGFLSTKFIEGKRRRYLHPMRLFFLTLVVQFSLFAALTKTDIVTLFSNNNVKDLAKSEIYDDFKIYKDSLAVKTESTELDSLERAIFKGVKHTEEDSFHTDLTFLQIDLTKYPMLKKDVYEMPIDSILIKYEVKTFAEKLIIGQYVRSMRDLNGALRFFLGNMIWSVISTIFILAFLMKFLYIRKKRYYVEHAVVLANIHSFAFILVSLAILPTLFTNQWQGELVPIVGIFIPIYFLWSLKSYYKQGFFKTLLKFGIISILYLLLIALMIIMVLIVSVLLF